MTSKGPSQTKAFYDSMNTPFSRRTARNIVPMLFQILNSSWTSPVAFREYFAMSNSSLSGRAIRSPSSFISEQERTCDRQPLNSCSPVTNEASSHQVLSRKDNFCHKLLVIQCAVKAVANIYFLL